MILFCMNTLHLILNADMEATNSLFPPPKGRTGESKCRRNPVWWPQLLLTCSHKSWHLRSHYPPCSCGLAASDGLFVKHCSRTCASHSWQREITYRLIISDRRTCKIISGTCHWRPNCRQKMARARPPAHRPSPMIAGH